MSAQYYLTSQHATDTHRIQNGEAKCGAHVMLVTVPNSRLGELDNCRDCYGYPRFDRFSVRYWPTGEGYPLQHTAQTRDEVAAFTRKVAASGGKFAVFGYVDGEPPYRVA